MIPDPLFLGVDLGTSSLKCGLFNLTGYCAGAARVAYPTLEWEGGAEQQCVDWWSALTKGVRLATAGVDPLRIAALGIGGHAPSPVFVDANLEPVWPVLPWLDDRSRVDRDRLLQILGRHPKNGGERLTVQVAARAMWLRSTAPGEMARATCVLHSGDYLVARLTGQRVITSPISADVFAAAELPLGLLPERECQPGEMVGRISSDVAEQLGLDPSVPVVSGGLDSFLASVGSGLREPGDACLNTGSSSVVALLAQSTFAGRFEWAGFQLLSRPTRMGGRILQWARRFAAEGDVFADLLSKAAHLQSPPQIPHFLAGFLQESRREDREARKALSNLAHCHTPPEMFRLLLDAIYLSQRTVLEELEQQSEPVRRVRLVGGLAAHADLNQLHADVLGRSVEVPQVIESGTLGAAMLGAVALGHCTSSEASSRMVRPLGIYHPREEVAATYEVLFHEAQRGTIDVNG